MKCKFHVTMICTLPLLASTALVCIVLNLVKLLATEGWVPTQYVDALKISITQAAAGSGSPPAVVEVDPAHPNNPPGQPPTYFPLNKFTRTFQVCTQHSRFINNALYTRASSTRTAFPVTRRLIQAFSRSSLSPFCSALCMEILVTANSSAIRQCRSRA